MNSKNDGVRIRKKLVVGLAVMGSALALSLPALADSDVQPSKVSFPSEFGSMQFPDQFPDGTTLSITQWSHFVPKYDKWFDQYAQKWGEANNVKVTVNHINLADLGSSLASAIAAKKGSTLYEMVSPPTSFIEGLQSLNDVNEAAHDAFGDETSVCEHSSYLPLKDKWYGMCHGWVPDPGGYRVSLWQDIGYPNGPSTYKELYDGASKIFKKKGIPADGGMSPNIDAEFFARSLIWAFGGAVQDKHGKVVFDSPEVVNAVKWMKKYHENAQTPEVYTWNAASNNQVYIAGQLSYVQNSISYYRSAQESHPKIADDTGFTRGMKGPSGEIHQTSHVYLIYVMPKYITDNDEKQAGKKFMLDLLANYSNGTYNSELYDFPGFPKTVPQLWKKGGWLDNDPFGSKPADKLDVLRDSAEWTDWVGYPGYANPAVGQIYSEHLITEMMARVTRGKESPEEAVKKTAAQMERIFDHWRKKGFIPEDSD